MENENTQNIGDYPLWKPALRALRARPDYGYGLKLPVEYFEHALGRKRDHNQFAFDMLQLKQIVESEDGYYLRCRTEMDDETGLRVETWQIPAAAEHEDVAEMFESKLSNYAKRAVDLRQRTLDNPAAELTDEQRRAMESSLERAAVRSILLKRQQSVVKCLRKHDQKLLT